MRTANRHLAMVIAVLFTAGCLLVPAMARAETSYNVNRKGVAIKGYDPVGYYTEGRPVKGDKGFAYQWGGATWHFAGAENRETFKSDPEKYAPRYGGWCAYGVAVGGLYRIKPEAWNIVDGRLYLNKNLRVRETWKQDIPGYIEKADANWPGLRPGD